MGTPLVIPPAAPLVVECPVCKVPLSEQALENHANKKIPCVPSGVPKHCCVVCDKSFKDAAGLRQHQQGQRHLKRAAGVEAEEKLREAARENAQEAARLESVLAAGCGVCGIECFSRECIMLVHNQSQKHAAAVLTAALKAPAAEDAAVTAATADRNTWPSSSSSTLTKDRADSDEPLDAPETHRIVASEAMNASSIQGFVHTEADAPAWQTIRQSAEAQTFGYCLDDVYRSLGYSRIDALVRILRCEYAEGKDFTTTHAEYRRRGSAPIKYWVTHRCLAMMTARCRSRKMSRSPGDVELPGGITLNHINLYASKEESTIGFMYRALRKSFDCETQYKFGGSFRADLFIPRARLIVECDESGHKFYDPLHESSRDAAIRRAGFRTYRYNPDSQDFDLASTLGDIFSIVSSVAD